uniref:TF-B3 domain-containing protein n=1 Tax=Oryza rufipogon TaxID=4529 RepID=A0A0E0NQ33_ORYRU
MEGGQAVLGTAGASAARRCGRLHGCRRARGGTASSEQCSVPTRVAETFAVQFSERYINKYIGSPIDDLMVSMAGTTQSYQMRLKRSKDSSAMLTTGWNQLIDAKAFDEGDVCLFHFKEVDDVLVLKVHVLK